MPAESILPSVRLPQVPGQSWKKGHTCSEYRAPSVQLLGSVKDLTSIVNIVKLGSLDDDSTLLQDGQGTQPCLEIVDGVTTVCGPE